MRHFLGICAVFCLAGAAGLFGLGEKTLVVGGKAGWGAVETFDNITELARLRPAPVLAISSARRERGDKLDLYLSFDEGDISRFKDGAGRYRLAANSDIHVAGPKWARRGAGAALFSGVSTVSYHNRLKNTAPLVISPAHSSALLAPGRAIGDFSIEFFLFPNNVSGGEEIINWQATLKSSARNISQTIVCAIAKNRLAWTFDNFWVSPDNKNTKKIEFTSNSPLALKAWSHHLVRFDSQTGLLEYFVDGVPEAALYTSANGKEGGEVYTPVAGERGALLIGSDFTGLIDEFIIAEAFSEIGSVSRYLENGGRDDRRDGGRIETKPLNLGGLNSAVKKIDVSGGRVKLRVGVPDNQHETNGAFHFADAAQMQFFVRAANSPSELGAKEWRTFKSGEEIFSLSGPFVQLAAAFYPSGDLEASPYLEEIKIEYTELGAPVPPVNVVAVARDGAVDLSWKERQQGNTAGYLVYYGTKAGDYFCEDAGLGASPVDVGKATRLHLDNLKNGTLYFFAIAAYDELGAGHAGEFSREASARPLGMIE
ncbi:MAG: hypothetical protein LBT01_02295 [Spirochaetaceae bacterium]|jgi:hypothetical protein|nr:hypothetical protein [Spirochaetaceae bacterium]